MLDTFVVFVLTVVGFFECASILWDFFAKMFYYAPCSSNP
jgi:hypothetical protein